MGRAAETDELAPGAIFADRYEVHELLGRGGMGAVYRVRDLGLGEVVALKILSLGQSPPPVAVLRFREEVRLARRVTHPNVARVYDIGEHEERIFLTMEFVDGSTLRGVLRAEGRLSPARAARIAQALADGLQAAHAAGVVHRDLKPANVLIDRQGRVVITDFGIARSLEGAPELTVGAIGTPSYMAPEQALGGHVDGRTDVYALGLVLAEMILGDKPGMDGAERVAAAAPPALAALVRRCIELDREARPRSAEEVSRLLGEAALDPTLAAPAEQVTLVFPRERAGPGAATPFHDGAASGPKPRAPAEPTSATSRAPATPPTSTTPLVGSTPAVPVLAVLPFQYRGPKDHEYLGDAAADELVDALSRTRGLRVLGSGATARFRDTRDPRAIGAELGAHAVVDGSVRMNGAEVRITARLVDVASGVQLWSDRHDGAIADLFALQESIGRRVAEQLRVEITTLRHTGGAPAEAVELYLSSRQRSRTGRYATMLDAILGLERCIELVPDFAPALAAHANACLRCWFITLGPCPERDWEKESEASVAPAIARAPELPETHLAAGIHATQYGRYRAAVQSLTRALAIAPTCPDALEYLGVLQCEAGQAEQGEKSLRLADELDPTLPLPLLYIARHHALRGRFDQVEAIAATLERRGGVANNPLALIRSRFALWRGDREALGRLVATDSKADTPWMSLLQLYARIALGMIDEAECERRIGSALAASQSPRAFTMLAQLAAEAYAAGGALRPAWVYFRRAADSVLVDLDWLDLCPVLAPLRELPEFPEARGLVRARAEAIWSA